MLGLGIGVSSEGSVRETLYQNHYAIEFDGGNDYLTVADHNDLSIGDGSTDTAFAVAAWVKVGAAVTQGTILAKDATSSGGAGREWHFLFAADDQLRFRVYDNSSHASSPRYIQSEVVTAFTSFASGGADAGWHHFAATYEGGEPGEQAGITIYIDGVAPASGSSAGQQTKAIAGSGTFVASENLSNDLWIGSMEKNNFTLAADMTDIAIWKSTVPDADGMASIYEGGTPTKDLMYNFKDYTASAGLVAYWKTEENTGTTTADATGNRHTATFVNDPVFVPV